MGVHIGCAFVIVRAGVIVLFSLIYLSDNCSKHMLCFLCSLTSSNIFFVAVFFFLLMQQ